MSVSWAQALAWRLRQHLLDPVGTAAVAQVVRRLGAVPAYPDSAAELAVGARRDRAAPGDLTQALADGHVVKTYAFRGATHLLTPEEGGAYLALRAAGRMWELPSWQRAYGLAPSDWPALRDVVRDALADGPLTREALAAAVTGRPPYRHLAAAFADRSDTFLKPFAWQGDLSFGLPLDGRATFQRLDLNPRWGGVPELDDAGIRAVEAYVRVYGPTTHDRVHYWLGQGLGAPRARLRAWLAALGDRLATVDVDGEPALVLREDLDDLASSRPSTVVRLLPGNDQWVLGPGTADARVVPPARRALVSRGANIVVAGGVVSGTWSVKGGEAVVSWFSEAAPPVGAALADEVARLAGVLGRPLQPVVRAG
jgi:hypothetical protein